MTGCRTSWLLLEQSAKKTLRGDQSSIASRPSIGKTTWQSSRKTTRSFFSCRSKPHRSLVSFCFCRHVGCGPRSLPYQSLQCNQKPLRSAVKSRRPSCCGPLLRGDTPAFLAEIARLAHHPISASRQIKMLRMLAMRLGTTRLVILPEGGASWFGRRGASLDCDT